MRRRTLVATAAAAAAATTIVAVRHTRPRSDRSDEARVVAAVRHATRAQVGLVPRAHYLLTFEQRADVGGQPPIEVAVRGEWIVSPHRSGRTEILFVPEAIDGPRGQVPGVAEVTAPVQLVRTDGVLTAMGFTPSTPEPGRALLTALATTFQQSERAGDRWQVTEDDVMGRYRAIYQRTGDVLDRRRTGYLARRGPGGLSAPSADSITPTERTRFEVDADGVVRAAVELELHVDLGAQMPSVDTRLHASLERTAIEWVEPSASPLLAAEPISDHADYRQAFRSADQNLVGGATGEQLIAELARLARLDPASPGVGHDRAILLTRLAAAIRLDPPLAAKVADAISAGAADRMEVELLAGALASAQVPEGTDALAGLVRSALPAASKTTVINALTFAEPVTAGSLAALTASLDGADHEQAAMALGSHGRRAEAGLAASARAATDELLGRYASATGADRVVYARALGNSGSPAAVAPMRAAMASADPALRDAAVFSLRFIPGSEVDDLLARALADPALAFSAVRAIGFRDAARWRERLEEAQERYAGRNDVMTAIHNALRRWG